MDMIVANSLRMEGAGFGADTNVVTVITRDGIKELEKMPKSQVAHRILDRIFGGDEGSRDHERDPVNAGNRERKDC